jgi:2-dehydro-3-deoxy-D-gluconate 5-dehydrogenase
VKLFRLDGKVALVTGGNGGLGLAMAHALAEAGAQIAICGRDPEKLRRAQAVLSASTTCSAHRIDLAEESSLPGLIDEVVAAHGGLNIVIHNAGISRRGAPHELPIADYEAVMQVNVSAALRLSQLAYPHLQRGGGKLIFIGSMFSHLGSAFSLPYAVSKGAVVQLTRSLGVAWAKDGIQVNAILPGWFDTELTQATRAHVPGLEAKIVAATPAGRWGAPSDLAGAAVFLSSRASDFVTASCLTVDGGYSASM